MTLQQLKYLVTVAECKNITEAAEKLFISQPSLSAAIHNLEKEMGVTAFVRSNKGVSVTREGEELLSFARNLLEQADIMKDRFCNDKSRMPKFSVSCQHYSFAVNAFVDVVNKYDANIYSFILRETQTGEMCVLLGPSGSGKSTLLNIIGAIESADEGYIAINNEKTRLMSEKKLTLYRRKHIGYVFQMYNLIPNLTVRENIEVGAYLSDNPLDIDELMNTLGISEQADKLPSQLSGGQQQRTSIGRAVVKNPDILLCDEPTGALDYNTSKQILKLLEDVNKKYGNTVIMVTHNDAIKNMADRVFTLRDGEIRKNYVNENKISADDLEW
jgi:putative ABC transport system ATP-binding protein